MNIEEMLEISDCPLCEKRNVAVVIMLCVWSADVIR